MSTKTISAFIIFTASILLIVNLVRDIWRLKKVDERFTKAQTQLEEAKKTNQELIKQKEYYQSEAFLEEQIRNKLQMGKPGEKIVILPEELREEKVEPASAEAPASANATAGKPAGEKEANWQKWLALFK